MDLNLRFTKWFPTSHVLRRTPLGCSLRKDSLELFANISLLKDVKDVLFFMISIYCSRIINIY